MAKRSKRASDLTIEAKVLTALYFYGHGDYQKPVGRSHFVAQQTVSSVLAEVTTALNHISFRNKYIKFPQNYEDRHLKRLRFFNKFGIPDVLGCIDCTHVRIVRPNEHEDRFFCGKKFHSLNVQLICDADQQILSVDASHPGSFHDSFIWSHHPVRYHLDNLESEATWLLGDSGYSQRRTMMTPILDAEPDTPEAYYTQKHVKAMNVMESTISLLKARFRCLLCHKALHYRPQVAGLITNACVILHNICNENNVSEVRLTEEEQARELAQQPSVEALHEPAGQNNIDLQRGISTRQDLVARLWALRGT
ncbi:putative nuclease HARBI1 isoform X2 [Amyelois transitella]|nr:putative nuclease HARBI1 isoform X2 [Amyelois transitella]XP_013192929.1 putative nuclease HARBI1 isoform X2 [Amyelois transitella]XP_013192930.1 putative nuclease HARBI1 isoform X2 [Amyelois transitella]XP_060802173.1 putative nuclease HARBI1 isoform X2 [Amyelois transitella]